MKPSVTQFGRHIGEREIETDNGNIVTCPPERSGFDSRPGYKSDASGKQVTERTRERMTKQRKTKNILKTERKG